MDDFDGILTEVRRIGGNVLSFRILCPHIAGAVEPGQFVFIRDPLWGLDPFLMRPFAVSGVFGGNIEVVFQIAGKGTSMLSRKSEGESLTVRGPAGHGFLPPVSRPVYLAGTLGAAPLLFARERFGPGKFVLGVPDAGWSRFFDWAADRCPELELFSDDGSVGKRGTPLDAVDPGRKGISIMACGPAPMLRAISELNPEDCQVSMESRMACGIGACSGCVVETVNGLRRVCVDGPVFRLEEMVWHG